MPTMTGSELKALRNQTGLSQADLARAIGMARETIGQMERDQAPIEQRTALAVRYLAEHPEALPEPSDEIDPPEGSFLSRLHAMLKSEPKVRGAGSLETWTVTSAGGKPIVFSIRCRRA